MKQEYNTRAGNSLHQSAIAPKKEKSVNLDSDQLNKSIEEMIIQAHNKDEVADERFIAIGEKIDNLNRRFNSIEENFKFFGKQLDNITSRFENKFKAGRSEIGKSTAYKEIARNNHIFPSKVNLEPLHCSDQIDSMSLPQTNQYLKLYSLSIHGSLPVKKTRIMEYIGLNISVHTDFGGII